MAITKKNNKTSHAYQVSPTFLKSFGDILKGIVKRVHLFLLPLCRERNKQKIKRKFHWDRANHLRTCISHILLYFFVAYAGQWLP